MIAIRKAEERGRTKFDWLDSRHTFSFGEYYDPRHMGFRAPRVMTRPSAMKQRSRSRPASRRLSCYLIWLENHVRVKWTRVSV